MLVEVVVVVGAVMVEGTIVVMVIMEVTVW